MRISRQGFGASDYDVGNGVEVIEKSMQIQFERHCWSAMAADQDDTHVGTVVEEVKPKLQQPPRYQVVLLNDDYTPMDFVVYVLQQFFTMDLETATRVMLMVHTQGKGLCGVFPRDVAETKAAQVNRFARENEHPLLCEIEQVDGDDQ